MSLLNSWQQTNDKFYYLNVINMDPAANSRSTSNNSSTGEKYIKSGTNLQTSIWSDNDNEVKVDSAESFSNKEVSFYDIDDFYCHFESKRNLFMIPKTLFKKNI
jgi:hypothetical protein